jgi:hypothetical protein
LARNACSTWHKRARVCLRIGVYFEERDLIRQRSESTTASAASAPRSPYRDGGKHESLASGPR